MTKRSCGIFAALVLIAAISAERLPARVFDTSSLAVSAVRPVLVDKPAGEVRIPAHRQPEAFAPGWLGGMPG
jgi:hypothetical protein